MGKINWARVLLGGLITFVVATVLLMILVSAESAQMSPYLEAKHMLAPGAKVPYSRYAVNFTIVMLLLGMVADWIYAAIRPRYGAGPKTAALAGCILWLTLSLADMVWIAAAQFPAGLAAIGIAVSLPIMIVATIAGAAVYNEKETGAAAAAGQ